MLFQYGETITVTRLGEPTGVYDDLGDPVLGPPSTFTVEGVGVAPGTAGETPAEWGFTAENSFTLYLPYGTELLPTDVVTVRGISGWQVVGDAGVVDWRNPFTGLEAGTVAVVGRAS